MVFACKVCKKVFRKDMIDFDETDEFCPQYLYNNKYFKVVTINLFLKLLRKKIEILIDIFKFIFFNWSLINKDIIVFKLAYR